MKFDFFEISAACDQQVPCLNGPVVLPVNGCSDSDDRYGHAIIIARGL